MRKERGITLVSLVVTIIILIILASVSINLILGKNGIITMATQAKENTELAKIEEAAALNELYMQIEAEGGTSENISYDAIAKLTEFKTAIANYIEEAGGIKPEPTADTITFGETIKGIVKEVTKDATASADDITDGKTAWVNGELITGTAVNELNKIEPITRTYSFSASGNNGYTKTFSTTIETIDGYTPYGAYILSYRVYNGGTTMLMFESSCGSCTINDTTLSVKISARGSDQVGACSISVIVIYLPS